MPTPPIPRKTHEDVYPIKNVLRELKPGDSITYDEVARSVGARGNDPAFRRHADTARRQLERDDRIVVACVPGVGYIRETSLQTKERVQNREMQTIRRKAGKNDRQLDSVKVEEIPKDEHAEFYLTRVINRTIRKTTSKPSRDRLLAATKATNAELTVQKALDVLIERSSKT